MVVCTFVGFLANGSLRRVENDVIVTKPSINLRVDYRHELKHVSSDRHTTQGGNRAGAFPRGGIM